MRHVKREVVCGEGSDSIRRANPETGMTVCTHGPAWTPGHNELGQAPTRVGGSVGAVTQSLSRAASLRPEKPESYAFKEGPVISSIL